MKKTVDVGLDEVHLVNMLTCIEMVQKRVENLGSLTNENLILLHILLENALENLHEAPEHFNIITLTCPDNDEEDVEVYFTDKQYDLIWRAALSEFINKAITDGIAKVENGLGIDLHIWDVPSEEVQD